MDISGITESESILSWNGINTDILKLQNLELPYFNLLHSNNKNFHYIY